MARSIHGPRADKGKQTLPVSKGGTSSDNLTAAATRLKVATANTIGQPNGLIPVDADGKIAVSRFGTGNKVNIEGSTSMIAGQTLQLKITDFDSFRSYTLGASSGTISRVEDTIEYVAPQTAQTVTLTINGKPYTINVQVAAPNKPSVTSPVANGIVYTAAYTATGSTFNQVGDASTHLASDWQVSVNPDFSAPIVNAVADTVNKVSYPLTNLADGLTYYIRVRYRASNGNYGEWSDATSFTISIPVPVTPNITSPSNNAVDVSLTPTVVASAFAVLADNSSHASSDWQLASDVNFTNIVRNSAGDTVNKTSWSLAALPINTSYFARVRYRSSNGKVSAWGNTVRFTTLNAYVLNTVVSSDSYDWNMRAAAISAGWDQVMPLRMTATVNSGVVIGSNSTSTAALNTGSSFPAGSTLTLINNGYIVGRGGEGGRGGGDGGGGGAGTGGYAGGPALNAQYPLSVTNNGTIGGGGGGGGGAAPFVYGAYNSQGQISNYFGVCGGGGGGGAGRYAGSPGRDGDGGGTWLDVNGGNTFTAGGGSLTGGGGGGAAQFNNYGGAGGALGQPGANSNAGYIAAQSGSEDSNGNTAGGPSAINPGGAAGAAALGNGNITWVAVGTRLGPLS
jgi:hypothetical protein